jgi:hypothetical protein
MTTAELIMSNYSNHSHMIQRGKAQQDAGRLKKSFDLRYCC